MPQQTEKRQVPYLADHMFHLVTKVDEYPEFLPWVNSARIFNQQDHTFHAELTIGTGIFSQTYTSHVTADPLQRVITVDAISGPFQYLRNRWTFTPSGTLTHPTTEIEFFIDFEIEQSLLRPVIQPFLTKATSLMIEAFEKRAKDYHNRSMN